jgi:hypothetical protein
MERFFGSRLITLLATRVQNSFIRKFENVKLLALLQDIVCQLDLCLTPPIGAVTQENFKFWRLLQ